jgi:mannose-6-phosphate isomerase-like protein (cupin superfamily)
MCIDFRDKTVVVKQGEMVVVPKGVEHKPRAEKECKVLLIEPAGTVNTGNEQNEYTVDKLEWI